MSWTLGELAAWGGASLEGADDLTVSGISTDSRTVRAGHLFVAIPGENFDGHDYVSTALERGAAAVLVSRRDVSGVNAPVLRAADTVRALGGMAQGHRARFSGAVVAITGSNGKTTTKEMCADILAAAGRRVHRSAGNLNNHIGLPLSLLALDADVDAAVVELGMNHEGEIDALARIASPTVGAITQVAAAHLGPLGSLEAIARAKGELFERVRPDGAIAVNLDDPRVCVQADRFQGRRIGFGHGPDAEIRASSVRLARPDSRFQLRTPQGSVEVVIPLPGEHLIEDAICAAAAAWATGLLGEAACDAIRDGLGRFGGVAGRLTAHETSAGVLVIDDSYNANPASVNAALAALRALHDPGRGGRAIAVLGDMLELGDAEATLHGQVGKATAAAGVDVLIAVGERARHMAAEARRAGVARVEELPDAPAAAACLPSAVESGDAVLVKGSRGMRMERVVQALTSGGRGSS